MSEWIEWNGGSCPVGGDVLVDVKTTKNSEIYCERASKWGWSDLITHYRICGVHETTKTSSETIQKADNVNHPTHYTSHPSGVECIEVTEHFNFCVGNAIKYIWRAGLKNDAIEDLEKAKWYIEREILRRSK